MLILRTTNKELAIDWIGVSDIDGCLRFEVLDAENRMAELVNIFSDKKEVQTLTRVFDEDEKTFEGFTVFRGIDLKLTGNVVVTMRRALA